MTVVVVTVVMFETLALLDGLSAAQHLSSFPSEPPAEALRRLAVEPRELIAAKRSLGGIVSVVA